MTKADAKVFQDSLNGLAVATRGTVNDVVRDTYWIALNDLTLSEFSRGVLGCLKTCTFFPSPAEIRTAAGVGSAARAAQSWGAVYGAMNRYDYTQSVDFGPMVNAVVRNLGGWIWLCGRSIRELAFVRKDFERVYGLMETQDPTTLRGDALPGKLDGPAQRIAIPGERTDLRLAGVRDDNSRAIGEQVSAAVRELAEAKS